MRRTLTFAAALALGVAVWLATAAPADAATYGTWHPNTTWHPANTTYYHTRHMPGWDWWRTYPWSPYNYGRNPYNPIVVPYPYYVNPLPVYTPQPPAVITPPAELRLPTASGPLAYPPPGTALIRVGVPTTWAHVSFDGHDSPAYYWVRRP